MKFEIKYTENGVILKADKGEIYCYQEQYDNAHDAFADFLRIIADNYGPTDSRHDPKRIYIKVRHGDNYKCPNAPCEYCEELEPFTAEPVSSGNP
jgi:hypothetical protein